MKGTKVNLIWSQLNSRERKTDLLLSNIQQIIRKITFVSLQTCNFLVQNLKMDSLHTIIKLVTKNCFMASIDLKDAYYSIPVRPADRKFVRFKWEDENFEASLGTLTQERPHLSSSLG